MPQGVLWDTADTEAEVLSKEEMEAARNNQTRTRSIAVDGITVSNPQSVKSHRTTSLKAIPIFASEKSHLGWNESIGVKICPYAAA